MMLSDYPIYFDDTKLFTPESWEESYTVVESTNQTEAGTDQVIVTRYDKLSVSASFPVFEPVGGEVRGVPGQGFSIQVKLYDLKTQGYKTRTMRMRNFKTGPEKNSEKTRGTNGLYTVSFDLEEF
jgi:hypothetical protein